MLRITSVVLRFHVVPPHELLPLGVRLSALARHRACLTADAAIRIEYERELKLGMTLLMRIAHLAADLPVVDRCHDRLSVTWKRSRRSEPVPSVPVPARSSSCASR